MQYNKSFSSFREGLEALCNLSNSVRSALTPTDGTKQPETEEEVRAFLKTRTLRNGMPPFRESESAFSYRTSSGLIFGWFYRAEDRQNPCFFFEGLNYGSLVEGLKRNGWHEAIEPFRVLPK